MKQKQCFLLLFVFSLWAPSAVWGQTEGQNQTETATSDVPAALKFKMESLDGKEIDLSKYRGKVVVIVNTASKCGYTPQYANLQVLHEKYADQGLQILGFPCNQFGGQEPGNAADIRSFCEKNYGVEFELFAKIDVKGENQSKLFQHLTQLELLPRGKGDIRWNFEKFIIDRNGKPIARFGTRVSPESDEFLEVLNKALKVN